MWQNAIPTFHACKNHHIDLPLPHLASYPQSFIKFVYLCITIIEGVLTEVWIDTSGVSSIIGVNMAHGNRNLVVALNRIHCIPTAEIVERSTMRFRLKYVTVTYRTNPSTEICLKKRPQSPRCSSEGFLDVGKQRLDHGYNLQVPSQRSGHQIPSAKYCHPPLGTPEWSWSHGVNVSPRAEEGFESVG